MLNIGFWLNGLNSPFTIREDDLVSTQIFKNKGKKDINKIEALALST